MRAGKKPSAGKGGGNMQKQLAQVQAMQARMQQVQEEIEAKVGNFRRRRSGFVKINGKKELVEVLLKPEVVDPDDIEMLQDLIIAAVNEGMRQIDEISESEMGKVTRVSTFPGLF